VWAWGDALLQICQPRWPCFKLAMATGHPEIVAMMTASGRSGWYFRVLRTGAVPVAGPLELVDRDPLGVSVLDAFRAREPGADPALVARVAAAPALASSLRAHFLALAR
jgi:MOSC domain-containing protein YiiM